MKDLEWLKKEVEELKVDIHQSGGYHDTEMVYYKDLKELIDQVEQPELLVVPDFVAEDYEVLQGYSGVDLAVMNYWTRNSALQCTKESYKWLLDQDMETITNLLNGRFVTKEKKYKVLGKYGEALLLVKNEKGVIKETSNMTDSEYLRRDSENLTEQEIKDFDPRCWAFAKEINE